jgi:hypothetical protein
VLLELCGREVLHFHFYDVGACSMSRCVRAIINVASFKSFHSINVLFCDPCSGEVAGGCGVRVPAVLGFRPDNGSKERGEGDKAAREDG